MSDLILSLQNQIDRLNNTGAKKERIIFTLIDTKSKFPVEQRIQAYYIRKKISYRFIDFATMNYVDIVKRKQWYIEILQDELSYLQSNKSQLIPWTDNAISILYLTPPQFTDDYVLYNNNTNQLSVSDMLSVIGYAQKFIEAMGIKVDEKYSVALQVLNSLDLLLHNKRQDKPLNKSLHIVNDVLSDVAKNVKEKEVSDSQISGISLMVDLTIDFLVKK